MSPQNAEHAGTTKIPDLDAILRAPSSARLRQLKVLVLANWRRDVKWDLSTSLAQSVQRFDSIHPVRLASSSKLASYINRLSVLFSEFYLPALAMCKRHQYGVIVSWTSRMGVTYGLLNRLLPFRHRARHVTVDFHIDLRRKTFTYSCRLALLRLALRGMDVRFCTSTIEEGVYAKKFSISKDRFRFLPMSYPPYFNFPSIAKKNYIFSYGRSGRDFSTLINAAKGLDYPVKILSRTFQFEGELPPNVTIMRTYTPETELIDLIRAATVVVIPLLHFDFSVGQIALTEVMSLGCPLVLTRNMATLEYAIDGESAAFVEAGDSDGLRSKLNFLIDNPAMAEQLALGARRQALEYSGRHIDVFLATLAELGSH
jgi:glycosyltransferase involved in cell wall biosynthesis